MSLSNRNHTIHKEKVSVSSQMVATFVAIISAVALPQIIHLLGAATGTGTSLGEVLLPMHLPVLLVGFFAGPFAGSISGMLSPLCSFALSGMPAATMLPFMMLELCIYGLCAGLLRNTSMPTIAKVFVSQVAGRVCKAVAIAIAFYMLQHTSIAISTVWTATVTGLTGIGIQLLLIPFIVKMAERMKAHE